MSTLSTRERGYGSEHRALRERWRPRVQAEDVFCARCGLLILADEAWDLAHDPMDRTRWLGPMHAHCNRNTALEKRLRGRRKGGFRWRSAEW